ncbi:MAG: diguanylate cyclase [Treponema sp.]|nr:diguanylate cyclase [Treponema sp.]
MLEIDHFQQFNDKYRRWSGDAALRHTVRIAFSLFRKNDLFCRHGGEKFGFFSAAPVKRLAVSLPNVYGQP